MQTIDTRRGRGLLFAAVMVLMFFGSIEILLRFVGVDRPPSPRLVARAIDIDISFPFMRPDRELFWSPIPGFRGEFLGETVTINSMGLRGAEVTVPKPKARRRILCFGDSITFGYGVSDYETYAFHLGQALNSARIEVVNAGVTGYSSNTLEDHPVFARKPLTRRGMPDRRAQCRRYRCQDESSVACAFYLFIRQPHGSEVSPAARNTLDSARIPRASKLLICGLFQKGRVLAQDGNLDAAEHGGSPNRRWAHGQSLPPTSPQR